MSSGRSACLTACSLPSLEGRNAEPHRHIGHIGMQEMTTKYTKAIKVQGWLGGVAFVLNALEPRRNIGHIGMQIDATTVFLQ